MFKNFIIVLSIPLFFISCSTDFEVNAPWKDQTIVYGLIDGSKPVQYIKINKAFLGQADAYDMAGISDSINYDSLPVFLQRIVDGEVIETLLLSPSDTIVKDTGLFADDNNIIYSTSSPILLQNTYKLIIDLPNGKEVTGETNTIGDFKVFSPVYIIQGGREIFLPFSKSEPFQVRWYSAPNARITYLYLHFYYNEIVGSDTTLKKVIYPFTPAISLNTDNDGATAANSEILEKYLAYEDFYKYLASAIEPSQGEKRKFAYMDFEFTCGTDDFYTYLQVVQSSGGLSQDKPTYSNIVNGYGLFSSKYRKTIENKHIDGASQDSLSFGQFTKSLRFADSNGFYHP